MDKILTQSNLLELFSLSNETGPLWSTETEDLDCTFVAWNDSEGVVSHINTEVDVVMITVAGTGEVRVGDETIAVSAGQAIVIPKGVQRSVRANSGRLAYLNVHKRRRKLMPGKMVDRSVFSGRLPSDLS